jgi:hypothetical protein
MSSPSSSSSATGGTRRWTRPLPPSRRKLVDWGAAALVAAALYVFPGAILTVVTNGAHPLEVALLVVDLVVLVAAAALRWSSLSVLAAAIISTGFALVFSFGIAAGETCGDSRAATVLGWLGAVPIGLAIGTWGARHGSRVLWAIPLGWIAAALWIIAAAHLVPGGAGECFN